MRPDHPGVLAPGTTISTTARIEGELVYAIGDVHGRYDLLARLLSLITVDIRARGDGRRPVLVFCGDFIDHGPDAAKVLATLVWIRNHADFETHFLRGNHEQLLLDYLKDPTQARAWLQVGGGATLRSYGVEPPGPYTLEHWRARSELLEAMPASHLWLLQDLHLSLQIGDYLFVHAGVRPGVPLHKQRQDDLLSIREEFLDHEGEFEKVVVHGHGWDDERPVLLDHRIGIDTGAYATGVLTAVRLEDGALEYMQAREDDPGASPPSPPGS